MGKRIVLPVIALAVAGACAILWTRAGRSPTLSLQRPPAGTAVRAWPADQCWNWDFPLPDRSAGERVDLRLRQKSMPLPPGTSPTISSFEKAMRPAEAERAFGTAMIVRSGAGTEPSGVASVQLIDLADVGAASTAPGQSLRVLAKLSVGGTSVKLSSDATILPGGRFAGRSVRDEGTWADGELYLMSFWVESEGRLTQYDVLLEQSTDRPAH